MNEKLVRHNQIINNLRKKLGENNYAAILDQLKNFRDLEPDEDNQSLLDTQIELYTTKVQIEEIRKANAVNDILTGTTGNKKEIREEEQSGIIILERNGMNYSVPNNKKHRILKCAIDYCLWKDISLSKLNKKAYKHIAEICNTTSDSVKTTISRIVKDNEHGLLVTEKQYYIMLLANENCSNKIESFFSFLYNEGKNSPQKNSISA